MEELDLKMPVLESDKRIVLEQTRGRLAGIFTICGRESHIKGPLPEIDLAENMLDSPSMREPGPVSLVAVKRRYVLYRQIYTPTQMQGRAQQGAPFDGRQV
jgi:hypothetical protein